LFHFRRNTKSSFGIRNKTENNIYIFKSSSKTELKYIYSETYLIGSLGGGVNKASFPLGINEEFATKVGLYFRRRRNNDI